MSTREQRLEFAELIEAVLAGTTSSSDALVRAESWREIPWREKLFDTALHALYHYNSDADIRAKEPRYAAEQRDYLVRLTQLLRTEDYDENRPVPGAARVIRLRTVLLGIFVLVGIMWILRILF